MVKPLIANGNAIASRQAMPRVNAVLGVIMVACLVSCGADGRPVAPIALVGIGVGPGGVTTGAQIGLGEGAARTAADRTGRPAVKGELP